MNRIILAICAITTIVFSSFGQAPEANGWVVARSESGVEVTMDRVIRILGRLTVEERWDEEFFVGLYHLQCDELIGSDP